MIHAINCSLFVKQFKKTEGNSLQSSYLQLNEWETDPYRYSTNNQAINWHYIVPVFLKIYTNLQEICSICSQNCFCYCFCSKIVQKQYTKTILQICVNLQKYWNNVMSIDGSSIEIIDQSHGDQGSILKLKN